MKLFSLILFLILCSRLTGGTFDVVHDSEKGLTKLSWKPVHGKMHNIYRSQEPITADNFRRAAIMATRLTDKTTEIQIVSPSSGIVYYGVSACDVRGTGMQLIYALENGIEEFDRHAPDSISITGSYVDNAPSLKWTISSIDCYGASKYRVYCNGKALAELKKGIELEFNFTDRKAPDNSEYFVTVIDSSGNESKPSNIIAFANKPDLYINPESKIKNNTDLSVSKMFPVVNQPVFFTAAIHNNGARAARNVNVTVKDRNKKIHHQSCIESIPSMGVATISWNSIFADAGPDELVLVIDPDKRIDESRKDNNELIIKLNVVEKDLYFLWYGNVQELNYVNAGCGTTADISEWKRRGAFAGITIGAVSERAELLLDLYRKAVRDNFNALYIDEISGNGPGTSMLVKVLPVLKKENPKIFIAVWNIFDDVSEDIAEIVKSGVIDLLMLEIYIRPGEDESRIDKAALKMRKLGIADKTLIGLVTDKTWNNSASNDAYVKSVLRQMERVRKVMPESPGVAFWSADAPPGMRQAVDAKCYELYLKPSQ